MLFGDEPAGDPEKHVFAGLQKLRNLCPDLAPKVHSMMSLQLVIVSKKIASETMGFHGFAM
jgi:hypothetical protein